ncbi:unnamed protein product [Adineta ricciae]|uniref:Uncharacterized protein n=1 Tax=Adineta ricciae TaxID=249248 RepID=A0A813USH3_ADIRI|nr:unnamed protein product [Adineta ricciae]
MRIHLYVFILLCNVVFHHGATDHTLITSSYIKQQIVETIIPPYYTAYTILNREIVQKLLTTHIDIDETAVQTLTDSLLCSAKNIQNKLQNTTEAMERIRYTVDQYIIQLVSAISDQEEQVRQNEHAVSQVHKDVQHARDQVAIVQKTVQECESSLSRAIISMREAHEEVKRALVCYIRKRKGVWVEQKRTRIITEDNLAHAYQRLQTLQEKFVNKQAKLGTAKVRLNATNARLQTTASTLNEQREQQKLMASLISQIKGVEVHLVHVFSSSKVLQDALVNMMDFELVLEPLKSVSSAMAKLHAIEWLDWNISTENYHQVNLTLTRLAEILTKMPLKVMFSNETVANCSLSSNVPLQNVSHTEVKVKRSMADVESEQINYPLGVFVDTDKTVYIADQFQDSIVLWKTSGKTGQIVAGGHGRGNALNQFSMPTDVLIDKRTNSFIICDAGNRRIIKWRRKRDTTSGIIVIHNISCFGIAQDRQEYLYVSVIDNNEIRRFSRDNNYTRGRIVAGGNGKGDGLNQFDFPGHLFVDTEQSIYVSDWNNRRMMKWIRGAYQGIIFSNRIVPPMNAHWEYRNRIILHGPERNATKGQPLNIRNFYMDKDQTLFGVDSKNHRILEWKAGATLGRVVIGGHGPGNGLHQLNDPRDVIVDENSMFICDYGNRRVMFWPNRNGEKGELFIDDILCWKLAIDDQGSLYVTHLWGGEVKRYRVGENVTVVAGGNSIGGGLNQLSTPLSIFVDQDYSVYVLDARVTFGWNHVEYWRVVKWAKDAEEGILIGEGHNPQSISIGSVHSYGMFVDSLGTVYAVDPIYGRVMRWLKHATQGIAIVTQGCPLPGKHDTTRRFIAFDRHGDLYASDIDGPILQRFSLVRQLNKPKETTASSGFHFSCSAAKPNITETSRWAQRGTELTKVTDHGVRTYDPTEPFGLCVSQEGDTILVTKEVYHRVEQWRLDVPNKYKMQVVAGDDYPGSENNELYYPQQVIVDQESLIICDQLNKRIVRWPYENGTAGEIILGNISCAGIALDNQRSLYVVHPWKDEVRRYRFGETNGTLVAGGYGKGKGLNQFEDPTHIFVDQDYSVYVSDTENHRVMKWLKGAKEGVIVAGGHGKGNSVTQLSYPKGVFVDSLGAVYVADRANHRIMRWVKGATEGTVVIDGNVDVECEYYRFKSPEALVFDQYGNMYVSEPSNHRVQRFNILS